MPYQRPPDDPDLIHLTGRPHLMVPAAEDAGRRLDQLLADQTGLSRSKCRALIDFGSVWVNGRVCRKLSHPVAAGDRIDFQAPRYGPVRFYEIDPDRILFEDDWLLAYDKEAGLPCQQTPYDGYNHLFGALKRRGEPYLALHHRLDAPTSGVMVFARQRGANSPLGRMFRESRIQKTYLALVSGRPAQPEWTVDRPVAKINGRYVTVQDGGPGKPARTVFQLLDDRDRAAVVQARPQTGRTHQIRLHLAASGLPIVGDPLYGGRPAPRMMLHALSLKFDHPADGRTLTITAPAPKDFDRP